MGGTSDKLYGAVRIPSDLLGSIDERIIKHHLGFRSRSEFVIYSVRKELETNGFKKPVEVVV